MFIQEQRDITEPRVVQEVQLALKGVGLACEQG